jgi:hypothetical protein
MAGGGCPLGEQDVQVAAAELRADSWCVSRDGHGNIHLCLFQGAPGRRVCVVRALVPAEEASKLQRSLAKLLQKPGPEDAGKREEELRYIA